MIRAFVAIDLPESVRENLEKTARQLESLDLHGRTANVGGLHLTLKFLGNIDEDQIPPVNDALRSCGERVRAFELRVRGVGVFPHAARPRVIWAGVEANDVLTDLQARVEAGLGEIGFSPEKRQYHPHLTLMRLKSTRNHKELLRYLREEGKQQQAGSVSVEEFHLYRSILKPSGAEYQKLASFPLTPA